MMALFNFENSELNKNMDKMPDKLMAAVFMYASTQSEVLESYMKDKRPWRDRTGEAKRRLKSSVTRPNQYRVRIILSQGVDYGIWLELANEKKYAIIQPTLKLQAPKVIEGLNNMLNEIKL